MQIASKHFDDDADSRTRPQRPSTRTADLSPATTADFDAPAPPQPTLRMAELLGSGRHGLVIRASLTRSGDSVDVAVKIPSGSQSLEHEANALKRFAHPHVVAVVDGPMENGSLILELCDEGTLAHRVLRRPLSGEEAIAIVEQITMALRPMHADGWIHGDISPGNVGLRTEGGAALLDFATAHLADGSSVGEGTAEFAGPFRQADPQLDVRSLAATMLASIDNTLVEYTTHFEKLIEQCDAGRRVSLDELVPRLSGDPVALNIATAGSGTPPTGPRTRAYGPGPSNEVEPATTNPDPPSTAAWWVVGALVLAALLIAAEFGRSGPTDDAPFLPESLRQNVAAEQTLLDANARWDSATGMIEITTGDATRRFLAGEPGDLAAIADWNCDGSETLGIYRPTTNNWFVFASWAPDTTSSVTALDVSTERVEAQLYVHDNLGCATPIIR